MVDGLQNKKIAFIIQARMASIRLPGKILMPMPIGSDKSILFRIVEGLKKLKVQMQIYIATSLDTANDPLEAFCETNNVNCYRGSEDNVLSRFIDILKRDEFDYVVRLTGDNPIIDTNFLEKSLVAHANSEVDYTITRGLPTGMNFEIITKQALLSLESEDLKKEDEEHVTLFLRESGNYNTSTFEVNENENENLEELRLTIDYPSDYLVLSAIFSIAEKGKFPIGLDLIKYCKEHFNWLFQVNKTNYQKKVYKSLKEEIKEIGPLLQEYELNRLSSFLKDKNEEL
ncbi:hypothetical protein LB467_05210 [Salegentibacter sp. JZCK2]|uniref:cytidylyltransferase domain-containing protein n=1 Tax=Salegentibacter tibetensis TaxID=2873600 RepID=UPI001CC9256D|nr:hypothetical protein [Salegentibacter tibetensis]MBZ9729076.1 hypothetical protein [Salegentibacter tibetensis]